MADKRIEIFAVGKWNGMDFTKPELAGIVSAFNSLGDNHRVPLKFGHNDEQPMTDGQPALGWVNGLSVEGDKLVADVSDIPQVVMTAMDKKLYRNVSVELDFNVSYKGTTYPIVLSGVALLGADIPAVSTLKDLTHYLSRDSGFTVGRRAVFSAIAGDKKGGNMDMKELTDKVAELSGQVATLKAENEKLATANAKFTADKTAADAAQKKAQTDAKRAEVTAVFEEGVKAELITPAQRGQFTKMLRIEDDAALDAIVLDDVKALVSGGKKFEFGRKTGKNYNADHKADTRSVDQIVAAECADIVAKKEATNLFEAQRLLFARKPELAKAYIHRTDLEGGE